MKEKAHLLYDKDQKPNLTAASWEKTNDPVRIYLREMGAVSLLTRQGEVEIAKRIEKGQKSVIKALSRSLQAISVDIKSARPSKDAALWSERSLLMASASFVAASHTTTGAHEAMKTRENKS